MKIFVAIPVYDGKLQIQTVKCLLEETYLASKSGDDLQVSFLPSCSVPAAGRNQLVQDFMDSDCDKLIFLDADISFDLGSLLKIAYHPVDFVGGCYRFKNNVEQYPITWPKQTSGEDFNGINLGNNQALLEVETLPNGFLCLSRKVFEVLKATHPDREYEHMGKKAFCYFQMIFKDGHMHSEDSFFCREWTEAGGKVYLDPEIKLTHWDFQPTPYVGHIGNWLKNRNQEIQEENKHHA